MQIEIIETPLRFQLHGKSSLVPDNRFGEVGMRLMGEMWAIVKQTGTATTGINHWVYLADGQMFTGVELRPGAQAPAGLESLHFELPRYLKHLHVGPYQALPEKWQALKNEIAARGEAIGSPSLEVYGHHGDDPAKLETTILIGLQPKHG
ncbi:MAG: GyrI-like domain-containing protein [Planctomycetaceae bacterium]